MQLRGLNTTAASSAAVGSSGGVPVVAAPAAPAAAPSSCASWVALCTPLAGSGALADAVHLGTGSVDAEYAT
ncbi:hypothetical protein [Paraburkholderia fungorum]|jgi:hypothetical protein|uniref:hypothetical protein n=1 Tax=Paraburkholderia fungorum TaxID=134537 RepID=UPI0004888F4E|nr:hypothetical protein [Paraburkholderia fungorum]MBB5542238.1 hypothetical protein [Paraburkholderia fungorum]USU15462.1 hypothetical protein NFE55_18065 [Paraburkholderia fungorum]USU23406.1 hypothetical protein NFS19_18065 [Paraburkholderia fungorum]